MSVQDDSKSSESSGEDSALPSDWDLFRRWQGKDRDAGTQLFERYFKSIYRFFVNKVVSEEPHEFVQQTFERLVARREQFSEKSSFRALLFGIAQNVLREHYRRKYRGRSDDYPPGSSVVDMTAGVSSLILARQNERLLLEALRRLPLDTQTLVELYYWEQLSSIEIAEVLGVTSSSVRGSLRRARKQLAHHLQELSDSPRPLSSTLTRLDSWAEVARANALDEST